MKRKLLPSAPHDPSDRDLMRLLVPVYRHDGDPADKFYSLYAYVKGLLDKGQSVAYLPFHIESLCASVETAAQLVSDNGLEYRSGADRITDAQARLNDDAANSAQAAAIERARGAGRNRYVLPFQE